LPGDVNLVSVAENATTHFNYPALIREVITRGRGDCHETKTATDG